MPPRTPLHPRVLSYSLMLTALLLLAACGEAPAPEAAELPTLIPTIEAPARRATEPPPTAMTPAEAPSTEETDADIEEIAPEEIDEETGSEELDAEDITSDDDDSGEVDPETSGDVEAGEDITTTESITDTDLITDTELVTDTEAITSTASLTGTETITNDDASAEADLDTQDAEAIETEASETEASETDVSETDEGEIAEDEIMEDEAPGDEATEDEATDALSEPELDASGEITASAELTSTDEITTAVEPRIFFIEPSDGATVPVTFTVTMGYERLEIEPAGEPAEGTEGIGHFHILVDTDFVPAGEVIPNDEAHRHIKDGSTEVELSLTPGTHTLRLQAADGSHVALEGDQYRDEITVTVEE